jgi:hypothetical protein
MDVSFLIYIAPSKTISGESPKEKARDEQFIMPEQENMSVINTVTHDTEGNDN